ncbi:MAG: 50S ribosomal protein L4 [Chitinophagales bacterium]|nr:50S ribosomal protein L4 [Bacteroidota bacterium]MCB9226914.1 50S ribosomal protein L4 [Chitinophagales bacterium]
MKVKVLNSAGKETGRQVELPDSVFGIEPNDHAIYLDVKQYLANQRQGTHKAKERSEIAGSTKKIRKQKGSGGARFGDIKSPILRGGGRIFGPRPRNYGFKLNKKVKALARYSALTYKAQNEGIVVVEDLKMDAPKTKEFVTFLTNLGVEKKGLYVSNSIDKNVVLSSRNCKGSGVKTVKDLNTYEIMNCNKLILSESSLEYFNK